ncbi:MAG: PIG-L family deacetylase, partial [Planctomycetota bacterium]
MSVEAGVEGLEPPTSRARSPRRERQTVRRRVRSALAVTACLIGIASPAIQAQTQTLDQAQRIAELARFGGLGTSFESGDRALLQSLRDARNDLCVVFLASHPDDQYLLPATYLRLDQGYRVHVILATRGEGGQNSAGAEVADELGARRTIETEACARRLGLEIWHLNRRDAGFCRDAESTFEDWPRERTIKDLARLLRSIRPDLVLTTHHPEETHGHDQALLDVLEDSVELAESLEFDT